MYFSDDDHFSNRDVDPVDLLSTFKISGSDSALRFASSILEDDLQYRHATDPCPLLLPATANSFPREEIGTTFNAILLHNETISPFFHNDTDTNGCLNLIPADNSFQSIFPQLNELSSPLDSIVDNFDELQTSHELNLPPRSPLTGHRYSCTAATRIVTKEKVAYFLASIGQGDVRKGIRERGQKPKRIRRGRAGICSACHETQSPEWRKGPDGPGTLCNACGLRWVKFNQMEKKEQIFEHSK